MSVHDWLIVLRLVFPAALVQSLVHERPHESFAVDSLCFGSLYSLPHLSNCKFVGFSCLRVNRTRPPRPLFKTLLFVVAGQTCIG